MVVDRENLHNTRVVLWPSRRRKDIQRRPEDELRAKTSVATETEVVEVFFELGGLVRGLGGNHAG